MSLCDPASTLKRGKETQAGSNGSILKKKRRKSGNKYRATSQQNNIHTTESAPLRGRISRHGQNHGKKKKPTNKHGGVGRSIKWPGDAKHAWGQRPDRGACKLGNAAVLLTVLKNGVQKRKAQQETFERTRPRLMAKKEAIKSNPSERLLRKVCLGVT